jgi:hypothetical protein
MWLNTNRHVFGNVRPPAFTRISAVPARVIRVRDPALLGSPCGHLRTMVVISSSRRFKEKNAKRKRGKAEALPL